MFSTLRAVGVVLASTSVVLGQGPYGAGSYSSPTLGRCLLYTFTDGFRHDSIPTAVQSLQARAPYWNVTFDHTENLNWFNDTGLAAYDAVVFLHTTGEILDAKGKVAFQNYLNKGGNFAAIHAASAALYTTPVYLKELGALFDHHPTLQPATFEKTNTSHVSTAMLPDKWTYPEEVYSFTTDPRSFGAEVIMTVDPTSYQESLVSPSKTDLRRDGGFRIRAARAQSATASAATAKATGQGTPHPIAWYQDHGAGASSAAVAGRSWYTSLGHSNTTWQTELFLQHVMSGITWTFGSGMTKVSGNSSAVVGSNVVAPAPPAPTSTPTSSSAQASSTAPGVA
ncbi:class I glutamine amidotransferase-like protein [Ceratobasidium sp. AG-I]|nr:class I glutamine amidotransferase-like protein [Ceratobasidium sp. AG-I]